MAARFEEAVALAEQAFTSELSKLLAHLAERISGQDDGKPKVFRDSAVVNVREFFERFRTLNIGSSHELEELVDQATRLLRGVAPQELRDSGDLRTEIASGLVNVQASLDQLLVERPRRNIVRRRVAEVSQCDS